MSSDRISKESFWGFEMSEEDVGPGELNALAIELMNIFEGMVRDADEKNEEIFLSLNLEQAIRRFLVDPNEHRLEDLLRASPVLIPTVRELRLLTKMIAAKP